jgi:hypothetical protein
MRGYNAFHDVTGSIWQALLSGHSFARRDPWARQLEFDSNVATVIDPAAFEWSEFVCPAFDELVIYQVHVGTFTGRNDPETELAGVRPARPCNRSLFVSTSCCRIRESIADFPFEVLALSRIGNNWIALQ